MNEEYLIKIRGSMEQDGQAPADPIELMTRGSFVRKGSSYYITYKETEATGYAGCTTTPEDRRGRQPGGHAALRPRPQPTDHREGHAPSVPLRNRLRQHHPGRGGGRDRAGAFGPEGGHARFSSMLDSGNEELISRNLVQVTVTPVR